MKERRDLYVGPWVGEFGIEVLHWQGLARAVANSFSWKSVNVCSRMERAFLYEDFADSFLPYSPPTGDTAGRICRGFDTSFNPWGHAIDKGKGDVWMTPNVPRRKFKLINAIASSRSSFRNFSAGVNPSNEKFDLLIHARATTKHGQSFKNWPVENWEHFVEALPSSISAASVGSRGGAHKIRGTEDLRGIPLSKLAGFCKSARLMIGPSSGTMHFGIHCSLPVVTWLGEHRHHYFPQWNPFDVPLVCLPIWQPNVDLVLRRFRELWMLVESENDPIDFLVVATKRSGHHAIIDWLLNLDQDTTYTYVNDCVNDSIHTSPMSRWVIPSSALVPKGLNDPSTVDLVAKRGKSGNRRARIFSMEVVPIEKIPQLREAWNSKTHCFCGARFNESIIQSAQNFPAMVWGW